MPEHERRFLFVRPAVDTAFQPGTQLLWNSSISPRHFSKKTILMRGPQTMEQLGASPEFRRFGHPQCGFMLQFRRNQFININNSGHLGHLGEFVACCL
jgi:hypothetical protein